MKTVEQRVTDIISSAVMENAAQIDRETKLSELGMDSLQALQLLVLIERTYNLQIGEEELQQFTSIHAVADLVVSCLTMANAS